MASTDQNIPWFKETEKYTGRKQLVEQSSKENSWPWPIAPRHASSMLCSLILFSVLIGYIALRQAV